MIERREMVVFTPEEAQSIKELVVIWNQLKAVVAIGSVLGNTLKWAVGIAAVWIAFKAGVVDWIKSSAKS